MYRIIAITTCVCFGLVGCGSLEPKTASLKHSSYKELIHSDFKRRLWIPLADNTGSINIFSVDEAEAPRKYLNIYCNRDGGQLAHVELDKDVLNGHKKLKSFLVFSPAKVSLEKRFGWQKSMLSNISEAWRGAEHLGICS